MANRAGDFRHTRQPGQRATDQHRQPHQAFLAKADEASRSLVQAQHLDLEADKAALQQHPNRDQREQGEIHTDVRAAILHQQRQTAGVAKGRGLREVHAGRIFQRAMHEIQQQVEGNVVEHDAGKNFIGIEVSAQPRRHACPGGTGQRPGQQHHHQCPAAFHLDDIHRHGTARQRTEQQLAFGADVPDACLIGNRQPQRTQQNWQRLDHQFRQPIKIADRCDQKGVQRHPRVKPQADEQQRAADQGQDGSQQRRAPQHGARLLAARFQRKQHVLLR